MKKLPKPLWAYFRSSGLERIKSSRENDERINWQTRTKVFHQSQIFGKAEQENSIDIKPLEDFLWFVDDHKMIHIRQKFLL